MLPLEVCWLKESQPADGAVTLFLQPYSGLQAASSLLSIC